MRVMHLRGFVYPGPARPTFLIPYFGTQDSNAMFVQELDRNYRVAEFLIFDPHTFENYTGAIPITSTEINEHGLIGFVDREGRLNSGTAGDMHNLLAGYHFTDDGSDAFFAIEVMELLGNEAGLKRAIDSASKKFSNLARGVRWKSREISTRQLLGTQAGATEQDFAATLRHLDEIGQPDWVERFVRAWKTFGPSEALVQVAIQWLQSGGLNSNDASTVFILALPAKNWPTKYPHSTPTSSASMLQRLAYQWLEGIRHRGIRWAHVWQRLFSGQYMATDLIAMAQSYLESDELSELSRNGSGARNGWLRVWRVLWIEDASRDHIDRTKLFAAIERRGELFHKSGEFGDILLLITNDPEHQGWALNQFETWLVTSPRQTKTWATCCLKLLRRYPEGANIASIAIDWLKTDGSGLNAWYDIWSELRLRKELNWLEGVAYEWLLQGRIIMRIWPDVLTDFLDGGRTDLKQALHELAEQWLQLGKAHARRTLIEQFANGARGDKVRNERHVFLSYNVPADGWRVEVVRNALHHDPALRTQPLLPSKAWEELIRLGHQSIETFIENRLRAASVTAVLFGADTANRPWVSYEVKRSHELSLGIFAVDIAGIADSLGRTASHGVNPLSLWQAEIDGEQRSLIEVYPTYDWVRDNGPDNIVSWINAAASTRAQRLQLAPAASTDEVQ